ncbi:hypothetical protein ACFQX7_13745 [Luedemannella flava]|uniref:hypothetical protein n=1 Tax=Luedemannella flava TaxID=349316 RepID=UPI0031DF9E75
MLQQAASYCIDATTIGALAALEERANDYISDKTWEAVRCSWNTRNCEALAKLSLAILEGKKRLHLGVGKLTGFLLGLFGPPRFAVLLTEEIASRVPLPFIDDNAIIAARGIQVTGVVMCLLQGRDLIDCACFADVVMAEGKERMKALLVAAEHDWSGLRNLPFQRTAADGRTV